MNKNEQQLYRDISSLTKAVQKLVKLMEKIADKPDVSPSLSSRGPILTKPGNRVKHI